MPSEFFAAPEGPMPPKKTKTKGKRGPAKGEGGAPTLASKAAGAKGQKKMEGFFAAAKAKAPSPPSDEVSEPPPLSDEVSEPEPPCISKISFLDHRGSREIESFISP